jgi:hypothetical protein
MMGEITQFELDGFNFIEEYYSDKNIFKNIIGVNLYLINMLISKYGGISNFTPPKEYKNNSLYLIINQIIYDNIKDEKKINLEINNIIKTVEIEIEKVKKINNNKKSLDNFSLNSSKILIGNGNSDSYYSLIFLSVPFALKIKDKKDIIKAIEKFIRKYTNDINQILSTITCALFIHYALNDIGINIWIDKLNEDLRGRDDSEKYLDYINNYIENNFRNGEFILKKIDEFTEERNKNFLNNCCNRNNRLLSEKPQEQVLLIYDTLLRSKENWEKLVLFGFCNWNDNPIISLVLGLLYEILHKSTRLNKNLLKRFSFNL